MNSKTGIHKVKIIW